MTRDDLLKKIEEGFQDLMAYLVSLSEADFITNTDGAGWTVKDHTIHLSLWETFILGVLNKQSPREDMGIDIATWEAGDFDAMNEVMQQNCKDRPLAEVFQTLQDTHQQLVTRLETLTDANLALPVSEYLAAFDSDSPISDWIGGDTYEHYAEHRPWIEAI